MLAAIPRLTVLVLAGPVLFGLLATLLPAFGFFPALGGSDLTLAPWSDLLAQPGLFRSASMSFLTGLITAFISLAAVATFFAAWSHTSAFRRMQLLLSPLLSVPHAAAAFGLAFLFAPSGWLLRLASPELTGFVRPPDWLIIHDTFGIAMISGLVAKEIPFLFLVTLAALPQARAREHARIAVNLGYGRVCAFLMAVWPLIYPQIRLAVFAVIAYACSVVDVALILGPTNPAPLAVRLVSWMNDPDLTMRFRASAGAILQLAIVLAALASWIAGERIFARASRALRFLGSCVVSETPVRYTSAVFVLLAALLVFAGLFLLALWSISGYWTFPDALPRSLSLAIWERQLPFLARPLAVTMAAGLASTAIAIALVIGCLEREAQTGRTGGTRAVAILYLPLIVPQVSFVFGLQLFFLAAGMTAAFPSLVLVHLVFVLPYVFLSLSDPWRAYDRRYVEIARSLGASPVAVFWRVRLPMLLRPVLIACAIGFAVSVGQYLPTVLIGAGRWPTVTTEAVALASGGDRRLIGVYAFVQMLLPLIGFALATSVPAMVHSGLRGMRAAS
ncbi:MAG: ABC transporter permease subunit [Rhizobiaceae bacterium]